MPPVAGYNQNTPMRLGSGWNIVHMRLIRDLKVFDGYRSSYVFLNSLFHFHANLVYPTAGVEMRLDYNNWVHPQLFESSGTSVTP